MGTPKGGGYTKKESLGKGQEPLLRLLNQLSQQQLQSAGDITQNPLYQQSAEAIKGFLPGGQGANAITAQANQNFQQNTIPSITNALGSGAKSSSALNQALAGAGQNLNTSLAAQLAQMQLQAAGQGSQLAGQPFQQGLQGAGLGLGTSPFAYMQRATPFWQDLTLGAINAGGKMAAAKLGAG